MAISEADFELATRRMQEKRRTEPYAVGARFDRQTRRIVVSLSTGVAFTFAPDQAQGLEHANAGDLGEIEISPSGFALHFPKLDADLYLPALLDGFFGSRKWMAARLGEKGGKAVSAMKQAAARENGRLGGRPKKAYG